MQPGLLDVFLYGLLEVSDGGFLRHLLLALEEPVLGVVDPPENVTRDPKTEKPSRAKHSGR